MSIIYIDAGHGGTETGAVRTYNGVTYSEKDINLQIAMQVKKFLATIKPLPTVYLYRETDHNGNRCLRGTDAKNKGSDIFVSIHNNAADATASGTLTLHPKTFTPGYMQSTQFAQLMQTSLVNYLNSKGWNVKNNGIDIWTNSTAELGVFECSAPVNACLVECAFMTNDSDMAKLLKPDFIEDLGYGIALGCVKWLNQNKNAGLSEPIRNQITPSAPPSQGIFPVVAGILVIAALGGVTYYLTKYILKGGK